MVARARIAMAHTSVPVLMATMVSTARYNPLSAVYSLIAAKSQIFVSNDGTLYQ